MRALFVSKNLAFSLVLTPEWAEHSVQMCGSIAEAHADLAVVNYDVVVSDMRLPDGTAAELARHIREAGLPTPLVVVGSGEEHERLAVLAAGADDYIARTSNLARSLPAAIRAANDRRRLAAANAQTDFDLLYVGGDPDFVRHLEASPGVHVTHVHDLHAIPDEPARQLAIVDAQGFEAAAPIWRIRETSPGVPIVLVGDADTLDLSGRLMPFGVDDVIVRSYDPASEIIPRLRSVAAGSLIPTRSPATTGGVMTHEPHEAVTMMPTPYFTPSTTNPTDQPAPDVPQSPFAHPSVTSRADEWTVADTPASHVQADWLQRFVSLTRLASQADVATTVIRDIDNALASVDQGSDPREAVARARSAAAAFSKFSQWRRGSAQRCVVDADLEAMTPLLTDLVDGWGELVVDRGAPDCGVMATSGELRRAMTSLVVACRDSLTAGGTVHLRSEVSSGRPTIDLPLPADVAVPVVRVRVMRVGFDAGPVAIPTATRGLVEGWAGECTPVDVAGDCVGVMISLPILATAVKA